MYRQIRRIQYLVLCIAMLIVSVNMRAQMRLDTRTHVDTLSTIERLAIRTNSIDWLLLQANVGVEYDLTRTNWNRWTIGANVRFNWATPHTFTPEWVYDVKEFKLEFRNYWRTHPVEGRYFAEHTSIIDRAFSQRRKHTRAKLPAYYRGLFLSLTDYDLRIPALIKERTKGYAITAGVLYGIVKPLYIYRNGSSLDLDLGISLGLAATNPEEYKYDKENPSFSLRQEKTGWNLVKMPILNEARIGLVYRLGKYHMTSRYRRRYDVDRDFINYHDSIFNEQERIAYNKRLDDSTFNAVRSFYQHKLDSIVKSDPALQKEHTVKTTSVRRPADLLEPADTKKKTAKTEEAMPRSERKRKGGKQ